MAEPKAQIRDIFTKQLDKLKEYAEADEQGLLNQKPNKMYEPDKGEWDGDLFNIEGMGKAFDRSQIHDDFRATVTEDGITTDLEIEILQGDFVAALERAYRARHHSPVRHRCHAAARRRGHRDENGVFTKGLLGYLEHLKRLEGG